MAGLSTLPISDGFEMDYPGSVEEAAALLGAAITRCCGVNGRNIREATLPPLGMHPAFAVVSSGGGSESELLHRLYILRTMLRTAADKNEPLVAAPSILPVLYKLLGISTQIAAAAATPGTTPSLVNAPTGAVSTPSESTPTIGSDTHRRRTIFLQHKYDTPPLWSTPCRTLWVDCVTLCHALAASTTATDLTQFVRQMLGLASIHPRSVKGSGGVRVAALSVIAALLQYEDSIEIDAPSMKTMKRKVSLATTLAPWSLDILQVCLKALRSAGNGEPTFREAAIRAASATATACRIAAINSRKKRKEVASTGDSEDFCLPGAMEDRAIAESIKILKQAVTDKFPEIRCQAAVFATALASILIPHSGPTTAGSTVDPLFYLEDVLQLAIKNLDDESLDVADGWTEVMARCLCTIIKYHEGIKISIQNKSAGGNGGETTENAVAATTPSPTAATTRFGTKKPSGLAHTLTTTTKVINFLVEQFIKVGGEFVAAKAGGSYSIGGRAQRLGWSMTLARFYRIQSSIAAVGEGRSISTHAALVSVLELARMEVDEAKITSTMRCSPSDVALCNLFAIRVLRHGLTERASESFQLTILQELVGFLPTTDNEETSSVTSYLLKPNQIQVALVEISNLIATLGEAAGSKIEDLKPSLDVCIGHRNSGIRYEATMLCTTIASYFPSYGTRLVNDSIETIHQQLAQVVEAIPTGNRKAEKKEIRNPLSRLPLSSAEKPSNENVIHGRAFLISVLIKASQNNANNLLRSTLTSVLRLAEMLVDSQFNEVLTASSPSFVCTLVRSGFNVVSGVLSMGPDAVETLMNQILNAWKKAGNAAKNGGKSMSLLQDLYCIEAAITSVTVFLMHCSELLLIIPEALSQVSMFLEDVFPLLQPNGRLAGLTKDPLAKTMLENATAALLEGFAWLPSGSFPLVADDVFSFAEEQIRKSVDEGIASSLLDALISKQDNILDAKPRSRATKEGNLGGLRELEEGFILISGKTSLHAERESVIHLQSYSTPQLIVERESAYCRSAILDHLANDSEANKPPTPLHDVGTWRRPVDPTCCSNIRLVDASIQAFSATFGLKDGKEQQGAINMLESLLPQSLNQLARVMGIIGAPGEPDKRFKAKDDRSAAINITAVLLSCLQALPLHEATHNIPIGLGPPWMSKAKVLLLTLLPSVHTNVRRASAEGLALLATLGVTEDAHFLQSALLHTLDEIMQSNKPDGKARTLPPDIVSAARAGSLLTLACIQRTAANVAKRKNTRARGRLYGHKTDAHVDKSNDNLPVLQMMTRILPSAACHGFKETFSVKTYALYSFMMLLMYSKRLTPANLGDEDKQLLRKGVELVEDNFAASWTAASNDIDRGQENERLDSEIVFVAVLLRLMTFLFPFLCHFQKDDRDISRRFSVLAAIALECYAFCPSIVVEAMAFFEVSCTNQHLLPQPSSHVRYTENASTACLPTIVRIINPNRVSSRKGLKAAVYLLKMIPHDKLSLNWTSMDISIRLAATLEAVQGSRRNDHILSSISASRQIRYTLSDDSAVEEQIFLSLMDLLICNNGVSVERRRKKLLRCILFSRHVAVRFSVSPEIESKSSIREKVVASSISQAILDGYFLYKITNSPRWQVKCLFVQLATVAIQQMIAIELQNCASVTKSSQFDLATALETISQSSTHLTGTNYMLPDSSIVFHLEDILSAACISSVATVDQTELLSLQENSMSLLMCLVECFGSIFDPEEPSRCILHLYSTQILSSVKSALLTSSSSGETDFSPGIFVTGCELMQSVLKSGLVTDDVVGKRLLSMIAPPDDSFPIFTFADGFRTNFTHCNGGFVIEVCSISTIGQVILDPRMMLKSELVDSSSKELVRDRLGIAVYLAATSIDGCRILLSHSISLTGISVISDEKTKCTSSSGFFFQHLDDLDDLSKSVFVAKWSQNAASSLPILIDQLSSNNIHQELCQSWIRSLLPFALSGLQAGLDSSTKDTEQGKMWNWSSGMDPVKILKDCMFCVSNILESGMSDISNVHFEDISAVVNRTFESVLMTCLKQDEISRFDHSVVVEACNLVKIYSQSSIAHDRNPTFLMLLLKALKIGGSEKTRLVDDSVKIIIESCILSIGQVIRRTNGTNYVLVISMMQYSLQILTSQHNVDNMNRDVAKNLLSVCIMDASVTPADTEKVLFQLATYGSWEEWAMIIGLKGDALYTSSESRLLLQWTLQNPNSPKSLLSALKGLLYFVQNNSTATTPHLIGHLYYDTGSDFVYILYVYGTMKIQPANGPESMVTCRSSIFTDSMKLILFAYRLLVSEENEDHTTNFTSIIIETFISVIRFNGLPNHPSPEKLYGDPNLGRICAQAILYVARTTPTSFKYCVASLPTDHDRTLLEFAVRAEMNGYVVAAPIAEPTKKKLSLQGFKKQ